MISGHYDAEEVSNRSFEAYLEIVGRTWTYMMSRT
jgi:hypothetical protein